MRQHVLSDIEIKKKLLKASAHLDGIILNTNGLHR